MTLVTKLKVAKESQMTKFPSLTEYKCTTDKTGKSLVGVKVFSRGELKMNIILCAEIFKSHK